MLNPDLDRKELGSQEQLRGLLLFYEQNGTPRDAWAPGFNTVSMFDIRHIHAVTYVAPYALEPRLSLTGWFRGKPL